MAPSADGGQIFILFGFPATLSKKLTLVQPVKAFLSGTFKLEKVKSGHRVSETSLTHKEGSGVRVRGVLQLMTSGDSARASSVWQQQYPLQCP